MALLAANKAAVRGVAGIGMTGVPAGTAIPAADPTVIAEGPRWIVRRR